MMKSLDQRPLSQRVLFTNAVAVGGVLLGFAVSDVKPSARVCVYIAVFVVALMNLMFLAVRPRLVALRATGATALNPFRTFYEVLKERPLITVLCVFQLIAACRATATTIQIIQSAASEYVRSLPNAHSVTLRIELASILMAADSALWFLSAIGLWRTRSWAWWMALVLNALAAIVSLLVQLAAMNQFLFDPLAALAVVLLLIQPVRKYFRRSNAIVEQAAL
jgi:hypothetical protein